MDLHIGPIGMRHNTRKTTHLGSTNGHEPGSTYSVLGSDHRFAKRVVEYIVDRNPRGDLEDQLSLKVVLQILSDRRVRDKHFNVVSVEHLWISDARQLKQLRGADGPRAQNNLSSSTNDGPAPRAASKARPP